MELLMRNGTAACCRNLSNTQLNVFRRLSQYRSPVVTNADRALEYFDVSYSQVYGREWGSVRTALLSQKKKYGALLNNYSPDIASNITKFKAMGCIDMGVRYRSNCQRMQPILTQLQKPSTDTAQPHDGDDSFRHPTRKPVREMDADELAELENLPALRKYPSQYREAFADEDMQRAAGRPSTDRVVLPQQHVAPELQAQSLHDFIPSDNILSTESNDDFIDETDVFKKYRITEDPGEPTTVVDMTEFMPWPETLVLMGFPQGDISRFPSPRLNGDVFDHLAMDAASILPVLLLGLEPGDSVYDMCAGPGVKTLALLQTCMTGPMQSNDVTDNRSRRITNILSQFYDPQCPLLHTHRITLSDGCVPGAGLFDRVLVDVPCLTDRKSALEHDNSIFSKARLKERLNMPELQSQLLVSALKQVRVGGSVVYSTCSLSPLQNDGVVHLALHTLWDHTEIQAHVVNISGVLDPLRFAFKFSLGKYGTIVLPWMPNNYGPMYFAKLVRTK